MFPPSTNETDYRAEDDARTLTEAEKIKGDKKRLKAATACLEKNSGHADTAHKAARKALEKHTKARLKKAFNPEAETPAETKAEGGIEE